jgi:hypothetical protein
MCRYISVSVRVKKEDIKPNGSTNREKLIRKEIKNMLYHFFYDKEMDINAFIADIPLDLKEFKDYDYYINFSPDKSFLKRFGDGNTLRRWYHKAYQEVIKKLKNEKA